MAMRSMFGKLKALARRMPRSGAAPSKDKLGYQGPVVDLTKYRSFKEMNEALPGMLEKQLKADREASERYWKFYDRVAYVTTAAGFGGTIWLASWFFGPVLKDD